MTRILIIGILTSILLISCQNGQKAEDKVSETLDIKSKDTLVPTTSIKISEIIFDTIVFKKSFDSLLSTILNKEIHSRLEIDTIVKVSGSIYPFIDSSIYTLKYRFKLPRPDGLFSLTVYESFFKDSMTANRTFKTTRQAGGRQGLESHKVTGLSYEFDYVIKYRNKMIDLNAPCTYADKAYRKLLPIFKQTFGNEYLKDTISCKCGWFCE